LESPAAIFRTRKRLHERACPWQAVPNFGSRGEVLSRISSLSPKDCEGSWTVSLCRGEVIEMQTL
jgi:hypothetical protein